jgi:hypothetical protein
LHLLSCILYTVHIGHIHYPVSISITGDTTTNSDNGLRPLGRIGRIGNMDLTGINAVAVDKITVTSSRRRRLIAFIMNTSSQINFTKCELAFPATLFL